MEENENVTVVLDLDLESAQESFQSFLEGMESLQDVVKNIGAELRKAFAPLQTTLQKTITGADSVTAALSEATAAMHNLMDQMANEQIADQWLGGISTAIEGLALSIDVSKIIKAMGSIGSIISKIGGMFSTVTGWITGTLFPAITTALSGIAAALGISVGWVVAIIAAIAAAIAAMVIYWDEIKLFLTDTLPQLWDQLTNAVSTFFTSTLPQLWSQFMQWLNSICTSVVEKVGEVVAITIQFLSDLWTTVSTAAVAAWNAIKETLAAVGSWIYSNVVVPASNFLAGMWNGFLDGARAAWEGVKAVFGKVAQFFGDVFSTAWAGVVKVFSIAGEIFSNIKDGILAAFKTIANGLIKGINAVVKIPFDGINSAIGTIRSIRIFDITPFAGLRSIHVPQIPYLAKGAVLPANRPFLAMVGDQRHGTNIEAPLATIQEAMALTLEDFVASNMAGHEATVGVLKEILEAVLGIHIGDAEVGRAVQRYQQKMAVVYGRPY